ENRRRGARAATPRHPPRPRRDRVLLLTERGDKRPGGARAQAAGRDPRETPRGRVSWVAGAGVSGRADLAPDRGRYRIFLSRSPRPFSSLPPRSASQAREGPQIGRAHV